MEAYERAALRVLFDSGQGSKVRRKRMHILLLADQDRAGGGRRDADWLGVVTATVEWVRKQCVMASLDAALERKA